MFVPVQKNDCVETLLSKKNVIMLASSAVLAICYDLLIAQPAVAASYPIFLLGLLSAIYGNTQLLLIKKLSFGWFLTFPLITLALTRFLFTNEVFLILNSLAIPVLFIAHVLLVTDSNCHEWSHMGFGKDIVNGLIIRPLQYITKPFFLIKALTRVDNEASGRQFFVKVLTGIIIFLPVLAVVIMLLSSADQVFEFFLHTILSNININEIAKHLFLIGAVTLLVFSFLWGLNNTKVAQTSCSERVKSFDEIIVITGLCLLTILYVLFSVIQFSYLFGGLSSFLPQNFTYAEYARRGFFELVAVTLVNVIIVVVSLGFTATSGPLTARILKGLNSALLISTFVMLISAYYRMSLYEEAYGYTYLRFFTQSFMAMIFVLLWATFYKVWVDKVNLTKLFLIIGIISYVLLNYVNVDEIIAQKNIARYYQTGVIDVNYLAGLSDDVIPYLAALTRDPDWKIEQSARQYITEKQTRLSESKAWQGYNLSEQRARKYLTENPVQPRVFDNVLWKTDKYQRATLVYDLLTTINLAGKSKNEIIDLLGNPELSGPKTNYYAWPLWSPASPNGWDKKLWITFKASGNVDTYGIADRE